MLITLIRAMGWSSEIPLNIISMRFFTNSTSLHKNYSTVKGRTERRTKCQIYK
ncbi:hypothetical protein GUM51_15810 [Listeria monocytogenes]|nr:hypothetical protein [Listeria monocytogenes]EDN8678562.1 hypothetical protein [Listeria monocytogenes]